MAEISKWQKQDCSNMEKTGKTLPNMGTIVQPGNGLGYPSHCAKNTRGSDNLDNLVMLHPNCHRQLHHSSETGSQYWGL